MAQYLQIDRIGTIRLERVSRTYARNRKSLEIPSAFSQVWSGGTSPEAFQLQCHVKRHDTASASAIAQQLTEIVENPDWQVAYLQFPSNYTSLDGYYLLDSISPQAEFWHTGQYFPFTVNVIRLGTLNDVRAIERWQAFPENVKGWATLVSLVYVGLPLNMTLLDTSATDTVSTSDGAITRGIGPPASLIHFKPSAAISDWFLADCRVYDSIVAGDSASANWIQVFSSRHKFTGDQIFQNGVLRYNAASFTLSAWNSTTSIWNNFGTFQVDSGSTVGIGATKITPSEIRWQEARKVASSGIVRIEYSLRRGSKYIRTKILTNTSTLTVGKISIGGLNSLADNYFNSSSSGTAASGALPVDSACSYQAAWGSASSIVWGQILTEQPSTSQPPAGASALVVNNNIVSSASMISFIFAVNTPTNPIVIANARLAVAVAAQEAIGGLSVESVFVGAGYF